MAAGYWDKLGWRKQLVTLGHGLTSTSVQINNGSDEAAGQTVITVDGGTDSDIRNDISAGDIVYNNVSGGHTGANGEWFTPTLMGRVASTDSATQFTLDAPGLKFQADNNDYIYVDSGKSGEIVTPVRTTSVWLDDVTSVTGRSAKMDWAVKEDFTIVINAMVGNVSNLGLAGGSTTLNSVKVEGSINGNNWVELKDFGNISCDGVAIAKVYDIDANGVLPYMCISTAGPSAAQSTGSDAGGPVELKIAVVPHG